MSTYLMYSSGRCRPVLAVSASQPLSFFFFFFSPARGCPPCAASKPMHQAWPHCVLYIITSYMPRYTRYCVGPCGRARGVVPRADKGVRCHGAHDRGKNGRWGLLLTSGLGPGGLVSLSWQAGSSGGGHLGGDARRQGGRRGVGRGQASWAAGASYTSLTPAHRHTRAYTHTHTPEASS